MILRPNKNLKDIYEITPEMMKEMGIHAILLDLDSTTMQSKTGVFTKETLEWFEQFKKDFYMIQEQFKSCAKKEDEDLKKKLCKEVESIKEHKELTMGDIELLDKIIHTMKNIYKLIEGEEYSQGMWHANGSYNSYDGSSRNDSYSGRHYVRGHYSRAAESMKKGIEEMIQDPSLSMSERDTLSRAMDIIR